MAKLKAFLARKDIVFSVDRYLIKALGAMAQGLFASLLAGLIVKTIGELAGWDFLVQIGALAMSLMGPAIGVAVAVGLNAPPLVIFASVICGAAGADLGGPAGAFIAAVLGVEFGKAVSKETKLDIMITPMATFIAGFLAAYFIGPYIDWFMRWVGGGIMWATEQQPLVMGIVVATLVGLALTAPISSAALCIMMDLSGITAGAACAGCAAQMIGFAVMSFKANGWGGLLAQGLGTSMLQIPNIIRHPLILLPPTLAGMVTGPLSITVWSMENLPAGAGMGTSGLVGQISTIAAMGAHPDVLIAIVLLHFIFPAALTMLFAWPLLKSGRIRHEHMALEL
ncbi:MAG: PTS sugar transporter subunit IIC [Bacillota bacterium]|nr:PTS sugar transporter subunit IIC [Bacillota bacterium]